MKITRQRTILILLSALPLVIGSAIGSSVLNSGVIGEIISESRNYNITELVLQAVVSTGLGMAVVFALFTVMKRRGKGARKLVVAFVVSPILYFVSLFVSQVFLLILLKGSRDVWFGVLSLISLAVAMIALALIVIDAIPPAVKNVFVVFYGSIFGVFMGLTMVTSTMFVMVLSLVVEDYFLTRHSPAIQSMQMEDHIGSDPFDYTRIQAESVTVGVGDYVAFSLISAHTLVFFPFHVWLMSMFLALVGIFVNMTILAREENFLPGIPLPATLALLPWIFHISTLLFLGG
ncbi:MAG: conserved membrane protein of unknown function [Candidatus Thorarchaeota archaeon]|nr:MAG: conserved membrane protein of unknown function [Candidatus Thorarchaeota archaeon]